MSSQPSRPPRVGFERVRTGCITCKTRRVKCDEARPQCRRCQRSGRLCAGYTAAPIGSFSWSELLHARPSTLPATSPAYSHVALRGMDFFRSVVAPSLAGPLGCSFWNRLSLQIAMEDSSAREAVLAISCLYENMNQDPLIGVSGADPRLYRKAVYHYNKAIQQVATLDSPEANDVLVLSVLFTCIEFLRGNPTAATAHCRSAILIHNSSQVKYRELVSTLRHLSIYPYFFGASAANFPALDCEYAPISSFQDLHQAREALNGLLSRSIRLVSLFNGRRPNLIVPESTPSAILATQAALRQEVDAWMLMFMALKDHTHGEESLCRILEMRWIVCNIWINTASSQDETAYDLYRPAFARLVELATQEVESGSSSNTKSSVMTFEMYVSSMLHFVVVKCRYLSLRLQALALLEVQTFLREGLWHNATIRATGKWVVEREHGIEITPALLQSGENSAADDTLPSEAERIHDTWLDDNTLAHTTTDGTVVTRRISALVGNGKDSEPSTIQESIPFPETSQSPGEGSEMWPDGGLTDQPSDMAIWSGRGGSAGGVR